MREIVRILTGSHLYGVNVPESDRDYKSVYIPSYRQILLGQGKSITHTTSSEQDMEVLSLQAFLKLTCEGQTNALDMLFAPEEFIADAAPEWGALQKLRPQLLSRQCKSFVGYCRQQAAKYAVKAERLAAVEELLDILEVAYSSGQIKTLGEVPDLAQFACANPYASMEYIQNAQGKEIPHLSVCETQIPLGAPIRIAVAAYREKYQKYGERTRKAKSMEAKDWKALYHAVRVAKEALELLETGFITLPRPERGYLLSIRQGLIPYEEISELLESHLEELDIAQRKSILPERPNHSMADNFLITVYGREVRESFPASE